MKKVKKQQKSEEFDTTLWVYFLIGWGIVGIGTILRYGVPWILRYPT